VILDSGVARPDKTPDIGASRLTKGSNGWLFGFNDEDTGFGFFSLQVTATGLTSSEHDGLISGFSTDIVYSDNRVYATSGDIVDVSNPASPTKAGQFAFRGKALLPVSSGSRLLMLSTDFDDPLVMRLLDAKTLTQVDSVGYSNLEFENLENLENLVSVDDESLAFIGTPVDKASRLFVLANPL
jgi:hypothetical protein